MSNEDDLKRSVDELVRVVKGLDGSLQDYPRRVEVERRFFTKQQSRRLIAQMVLVAFLIVVGCYSVSIGAYAECFTGDTSPGICKVVPGYNDRIARRDELNNRDKEQELRIKRLEERLHLKPLKPLSPAGADGG